MTFGEYVQDYGLKRSEGVVLRYLSDVYKGLQQNVPEDLRTPELDDVIVWLGRPDPPGRLVADRRVGATAASRRVRSVGGGAPDVADRRAHDRRRPSGVPGDGAQQGVRLGAATRSTQRLRRSRRRSRRRRSMAVGRGRDRGDGAVPRRVRRRARRCGLAVGRVVPLRPFDGPGHPDPPRPRGLERMAHRGGRSISTRPAPRTASSCASSTSAVASIEARHGYEATAPGSSCAASRRRRARSRSCSGTWAGRTGPAGTPAPGRSPRARSSSARIRSTSLVASSTRRSACRCPDGELVDLGEVRQAGGKVVQAWAVEGDLDPAIGGEQHLRDRVAARSPGGCRRSPNSTASPGSICRRPPRRSSSANARSSTRITPGVNHAAGSDPRRDQTRRRDQSKRPTSGTMTTRARSHSPSALACASWRVDAATPSWSSPRITKLSDRRFGNR